MANEEKKPLPNAKLEAFWNEISKLAAENYKKRLASNQPGDQLSDWLQAEKEIKKKYEV
jgi:hypothetical protein